MARAGAGATHRRSTPPTGIAIYCVLGFLGVLVSLLEAAVLVDQGGVVALLGYVTGGVALAFFVVLIGLWTLRSWAWTAGIVLIAIEVLFHAISFNVIPAIILSVLWIYLYLKKPVYRM